jgi:hypothetical protein
MLLPGWPTSHTLRASLQDRPAPANPGVCNARFQCTSRPPLYPRGVPGDMRRRICPRRMNLVIAGEIRATGVQASAAGLAGRPPRADEPQDDRELPATRPPGSQFLRPFPERSVPPQMHQESASGGGPSWWRSACPSVMASTSFSAGISVSQNVHPDHYTVRIRIPG